MSFRSSAQYSSGFDSKAITCCSRPIRGSHSGNHKLNKLVLSFTIVDI